MKIIGVTAFKGGVGKTTVTVNVAAGLARRGKKTLIVDIDPQGSATTHFGIDKEGLKRSSYDLFVKNARVSIKDCIVPTREKCLDIVPAVFTLNESEIELVSMIGRERILKGILSATPLDYDYVLIDTKAGIGLLTANAITAATGLILPVSTEFLSLDGHRQYWNQLIEVLSVVNPALLDRAKTRIVINNLDRREKGSIEAAEQIRRAFPDNAFKAVIRRNRPLADAPWRGLSIYEYDVVRKTKSRGFEDFNSLTEEIIHAY